jgi:hypothetical protein
MANEVTEHYDVTLSRLPLFLFFLMGSLFLVVGLDLALMHVLFPYFSIEQGKMLIFYAFLLFAIGCGGAIAVQMLLYMIKPPVMFRASPEGISFATGFRYNLFTIPWKYVEDVTLGMGKSKHIASRQVTADLQIIIKSSPEMPSAKATSMGVMYAFNCLTLSWTFMGRPTDKVREKILEMKKKYG